MGLSADLTINNRDQADKLLAEAALLTGFGAWECDLSTQRLNWTDRVYDLFGLKRGSKLYRAETVDLYEPESRAAMNAKRSAVLAGGGSFSMDAEIRTAAGESRWMRLAGRAVHEHGRPIRLFGSKQDITQEKRAWQELSALAHHDPVTGLANRRAFEARFDEFARSARDHGGIAALLLVDLDHFKRINDGFGHAAGDACLVTTAQRLERIFHDAAMVARLGGDEFAVLLHCPDQLSLRRAIDLACLRLAMPISWRDEPLLVSVSIGAATMANDRANEPALVFAQADAALYVAKAAGRNRAHIHGDGLTRSPTSAEIRTLLRSA